MKSVQLSLRGVLVLILALLCAALSFGQDTRVKNDLGRAFRKFDLNKLDPAASSENNITSKRLTVRAGGRFFELDVSLNDIRGDRYRTEDSGIMGTTSPGNAGIHTFKGRIPGSGKSEVRLTIDGAKVEGFFESDGERFFIEPASNYSQAAARDDAVVYRAGDSLNEVPFFCESDVPSRIESGMGLVRSAEAAALPPYRVLEMATEADFQYVQTLGGPAQANSEILSILNMVEGTYNADLGLSVRVVFQHTWSTTDPYPGATMDVILFAFTNYWNSNFPNASVPRDAAHLFTAKSSALSRGLAWIGVVCSNPEYAYGLSGYIGWAPGKFLVPAHEIGHNLGANHADAAQSCANSLMNSSLGPATPLSFCSFSQTEITTFVATYGSCLTTGGGDPTPTPTPVPTPVPTPNPTPVPTPVPTPNPTPLPTPIPTPFPPVPGARTAFDFDGDGRADPSVFRPSTGTWYLNQSSNGFSAFRFGSPGDKAVAADFDGDGRADAAIYRQGTWYYLNSGSNTVSAKVFGTETDIPVPADLTGDGRADVTVFRPSDGRWYSLSSADGGYSAVQFGSAGDIPVPADYDGDGRADPNVFRPSTGVWYRLRSSTGTMEAAQFGLFGDKPLIGDFDGDGRADPAVFRPSTGTWYILQSGSGSFFGVRFGLSEDIPSAGDFDGDGRTDISVFRPADGVWYRLDSSTGQFSGTQFGQSADQPLQGYYIR